MRVYGVTPDVVVDQDTASALGDAFSQAFAPNDMVGEESPDDAVVDETKEN